MPVVGDADDAAVADVDADSGVGRPTVLRGVQNDEQALAVQLPADQLP